ncbi:hypothetical protein [Nocardia brevicatena]|uniref:hypothetical protein n=1 Tax=Nocardia brevicatena TaxID=37327 RepID=UPI0002D43524|nr:hypothetical protein [Nocardia brevicatena]
MAGTGDGYSQQSTVGLLLLRRWIGVEERHVVATFNDDDSVELLSCPSSAAPSLSRRGWAQLYRNSRYRAGIVAVGPT